MRPNSKYPKGVAKQAELVDVALQVVAEHGYNGATIGEVAEAANLSRAGLLHHFHKKEELFAEVLRRRDDLVTDAWVQQRESPSVDPAEFIANLIRENAKVPGLVQLFARLSAEATDPANPAHEFFADRYQQNKAASSALLADMQSSGRLAATLDPDKFAVILAALQDGLQIRWLYDPSIDMAELIGDFFEAIAIQPNQGGRD
ncbi:TetR/AcrR family transcriptional regulator [Herbiconiux ginsengi]|uniref:Transcriptional regulator, TetR family n=1 Tax=Herbiconiux ginsengi TaxID=381665 RepID=A0A1H3TDV1_9MICO|nr:TetR/AcrR family transcriptional regulator [Herbiconiux ginsengi]SDZ48011.1 transcriptional regulator, TetR family [Herbiconiux ginsengi]